MPQDDPFGGGESGPPANRWFLGHLGHTPNIISIGSSVFVRLMLAINRHTGSVA